MEIPLHYPHTELDVYQIMPSHLHEIICILNHDQTTPRLGLQNYHVPFTNHIGTIHELPLCDQRTTRRKMLLSKIVGRFKMNSAKQINQILDQSGSALWQQNYYEHIIRSQQSLDNIRAYILDNSHNWTRDRNNPKGLLI